MLCIVYCVFKQKNSFDFFPDFVTGESFATFAPKRTKVEGKREHSADREGKLN